MSLFNLQSRAQIAYAKLSTRLSILTSHKQVKRVHLGTRFTYCLIKIIVKFGLAYAIWALDCKLHEVYWFCNISILIILWKQSF